MPLQILSVQWKKTLITQIQQRLTTEIFRWIKEILSKQSVYLISVIITIYLFFITCKLLRILNITVKWSFIKKHTNK